MIGLRSPAPARTVRSRGATFGLLVAAAASVVAVAATGAPLPAVGLGVLGWAYLTYLTHESGGRYEFQSNDARPLGPGDSPEIRTALLSVCERAGEPVPDPVIFEMDAPGAMVGYDDGEPVIAIDPLLPGVAGTRGLEAILAHELGHLGGDLYTDALRQFCPKVIGFGAFWVVVLSGRGPLVASAGTVFYLATGLFGGRWSARVRYLLSLGTELAAVAVGRYADRQEEYIADAFAAGVVDPEAVAESLYRIAAAATGENDEDVAGPIPWNADRTLWFELFATHPTVENRARALDCSIPQWARPYHPHLTAETD